MNSKFSFFGFRQMLPNFKQLKRFAPFFVISVLVTLISVTSVAASDLFVSDFETGDFSGWEDELFCCKYSANIVTSPKRAGRYAAKFKLYKDDPDVAHSKRAELALNSVPANSEQWYGFSVFVPRDYKRDRSSYEILVQWHDHPDFNLGENWRTPPMTLIIVDNQFKVTNNWDPRAVSVAFEEAGSQKWDLGEVAKEEWTDWVFHVKWSYNSNGLLEVWKNGELVVSKTGPTSYNDKYGPYLVIGMYKPDWKYNDKSTTNKRVIYFDEVRVGDASSSYEDVVPKSVFTN